MRCLVAGSSGFLGQHLSTSLRAAGHEVVRLVRSDSDEAGTSRWDPYGGELDPSQVEAADVVVNLAGSATVGNPHSQRWAAELERSRVTTTRVLAAAIAESDRRPAFLAGNGIGYYGDHGDEPVTEAADSRGDALLARVTRAWQAATEPASAAGARVCVLRTSPVQDRRSMPFKAQLLQFKAGLGGRLGDGKQYAPMVTTADWVRAVVFAVEHDEVSGPLNISVPTAPTNAEFTTALAEAVHRPAVAHVPAFVLQRAAGGLAPELLNSVRAVPQALLDAGFSFAHTDVRQVIDAAMRA